MLPLRSVTMATTPGTRGLLETIRLSTWSAARCNTPVIVSSPLVAPHQRNATRRARTNILPRFLREVPGGEDHCWDVPTQTAAQWQLDAATRKQLSLPPPKSR